MSDDDDNKFTSLSFHAQGTRCARITADGEVFIDWHACERAAVAGEQLDPMMIAIVRLMLAVRDGTWKPMP